MAILGVGTGSDNKNTTTKRRMNLLRPTDKTGPKVSIIPLSGAYSSGDVIGCSLDFDSQEIKYFLNGKDLGVAFKNVRTLNPLMPCLSIYRNTDLVLNLGPTSRYKPLGFYGLNPTMSVAQDETLRQVFDKYQRAGQSLNDSLSKDLMRVKGVMALGNDLGAEGPLDPHVLLLAWKLRSKHFFEFYDHEWMVLWANEQCYTWNDIKSRVQKWINDIKTSDVRINILPSHEYFRITLRASTPFLSTI